MKGVASRLGPGTRSAQLRGKLFAYAFSAHLNCKLTHLALSEHRVC
jgi:hypothetical protein